MNLKEAINNVSDDTKRLIESLNAVIKAKANKRYVKRYEVQSSKFHKSARILELLLHKYGKNEEEEKLAKILSAIIGPKAKYKKKLETLEEFQKFLIDLEVSIGTSILSSFEVPHEIPYNEIRLDIEEAIKNYDSKCYLSAQVMCRRAYEGALREKYKELEGKDPKEDFNCPSCRKTIRKNSDLSITKLHKWAVSKGIVHEKLQNIGYLIPELAAGAAHSTDKPFPRDKQIAKFTMEATFALLIRLYSKN